MVTEPNGVTVETASQSTAVSSHSRGSVDQEECMSGPIRSRRICWARNNCVGLGAQHIVWS
jgi:hypothetical protein